MNGDGGFSAKLCEERHMKIASDRKQDQMDHGAMFEQLHKLDIKLTKVAIWATLGSLVVGGMVGAMVRAALAR